MYNLIKNTHIASTGLFPVKIRNLDNIRDPSTLGSEKSNPSASKTGYMEK